MRIPVRAFVYLAAILIIGFALDKDVQCALQ